MFGKATNIKGKLILDICQHWAILDTDITQCSDCSIRVIVLLLIVSPNSLKIYLINILNLLGVPNLHNEINIDAISMGFAYKNEIF